jgi:phytoene dehydrogenase-like protein
MSKHYDVVVLGTSLGALAAAALLARRSWRVLVLGQGQRPPTYAYDGLKLARRPFTLLAHASPAWGRILVELAQSQTFRRRVAPVDPMLQVLGPRLRLDVPPDAVQFGREVDREFPEVRRVVDALYTELARTNAAADAAFDKDVVWPPGGFWERRETARVAASLPHLDASAPDFLAEFPRDHDYRAVIEVPARFASDADDLPPFALARLHGAWTRGVVSLAGGEDELAEFLLERVRAHGGEARLGDRAAGIVVRGGKVDGVRIDGEEDPVGVQFVVGDMPTLDLLRLAQGFAPSRRALAAVPRLVPVAHRFVVTAAVRAAGLPALLARDAFLLPSLVRRDGAPRDPSDRAPARRPQPTVHLQCTRDGDTALLVAEALLDDDALPLERARGAVLATIEQFLPFIERHYLLVDSPHDGRPLWDYRSGTRIPVDRALLRAGGASLEAEPMGLKWRVEPAPFHGLAGEPLRTPIANAFVVGRSTLPALGQEGELLAAWSASRIITRTDRRKEKMRRDMWSKVELG